MVWGRWIRVGLTETSKKNTIQVLDGVRAFACLLVIWFHIYRIPRDLGVWATQPFTDRLLNTLLFFGRYGVTLFFVLSGFLLFLPFAKALLFKESWPSMRQFYLKRVFRIMPAYYLSLILIVLFFQRQYLQPQHWGELGLFLVFFMDSSSVTFKHLNAPFWTLAIEWQFYMLLPLLVLGMRWLIWRLAAPRRLPAVICCLLAVMAWGLFSRYFGNYYVAQHPTETFLLPRSVFNVLLALIYGVSGKYLEDFGVGMLLALCFVYARHPSVSPRVANILRTFGPALLGVGFLCLLAMILWAYNFAYPHTWPLFDHPLFFLVYPLLSEFCISFAFGFCVLALLFSPAPLRRPVEWEPLCWLGRISYSLYMWHLPLLLLCIWWVQPLLSGWSPEQAYIVYWLWVGVVVMPFCFCFFKYVEYPGMKLGERLQPQKREITSLKTAQLPLAERLEEREQVGSKR